MASEKDINDQTFWNYFKYHNLLFSVKDLIRAKQDKNEKLVNNINDRFIGWRNVVIRKEIPENENPKNVFNIVEKILDFNKQQRSKAIKVLTPKQMFQRLPIALAQVKASNTFKKLLNGIRQIIFLFYWEKEITKKVYNNIINSIKL